nr:uncharacterized protein LOC123571736 [Macaca fascicularis]
MRTLTYLSKEIDAVANSWPHCLRIVAAVAVLVSEAVKIIQGRYLTVWTSHDVNGILTAKGDLWLSDNSLLKYQALLLEGPVLQLHTCATLNPATFLTNNEEKIEHNCQQVIAQTYTIRGDLLEVSLTDPNLNLYTDRSSFVEKGLQKAGYAVVSDYGILESNPLTPGTSAQLAELIALTWALELGEGKRVNIYTDSKYAYLVKRQMVLHMEPQMHSMAQIYRGPLDQPASPCSNVNDIEGTPPEEISTAQPLYTPIQQEAVRAVISQPPQQHLGFPVENGD